MTMTMTPTPQDKTLLVPPVNTPTRVTTKTTHDRPIHQKSLLEKFHWKILFLVQLQSGSRAFRRAICGISILTRSFPQSMLKDFAKNKNTSTGQDGSATGLPDGSIFEVQMVQKLYK